MTSRRFMPLLGTGALLLPGTAEAHPGHALAAHPLLSGIIHPLTGADHLAAMVMVGLWGGMLAGRARWIAPLAFVTAMVAGFFYAGLGASAGIAEAGIVLSIVVLGAVLALQWRAPLAIACALTGAFGFMHGMAHGIEAPTEGAASFAVGFVLSTALLHVSGVEVARRAPLGWLRALGTAGAGLGLVLALG